MKRVTAAVIVENHRLLIARRASGEALAGFWELPGGKVEPGETLQQCLSRELLEEFGMLTEVGRVLAQSVYHYEHGSFELIALGATRLSPFELRVHDDYAWVSPADIDTFALAPADVELVRQLLGQTGWHGEVRAP